jgi:aquaporin Z
MVSAASFGILLEHPSSPLRSVLADAFARRVLMGLAMGATAVVLVYSPFGKRSGAHINPAVTLTFLALGRVRATDAGFYVAAQVLGAVLGLALVDLVAHAALAAPEVGFVATLPGPQGVALAFVAEAAISFVLMSVVLRVSASKRWARSTGLCAGALIALYIAFEAPLSGMSMNPARSFGSAVPAGAWSSLWIYAVAPPLGMLLAALVRRLRGAALACAKLHHDNPMRCIFCGKPATS